MTQVAPNCLKHKKNTHNLNTLNVDISYLRRDEDDDDEEEEKKRKIVEIN